MSRACRALALLAGLLAATSGGCRTGRLEIRAFIGGVEIRDPLEFECLRLTWVEQDQLPVYGELLTGMELMENGLVLQDLPWNRPVTIAFQAVSQGLAVCEVRRDIVVRAFANSVLEFELVSDIDPEGRCSSPDLEPLANCP